MKAVTFEEYGDADVLRVVDRPRPEPGPGDLLVRVRAASVNPRDWMIRAGTYPFRLALPRKPFVLGSDVAGVVESVGGDVHAFAPSFARGDEVFGMIPSSKGFGGYAEFALLPAKVAARKPPSVSFEEAAAAPLASLTALQALRDDGRLEAGDRVVIVGASGGVGHYAVQISRALGAGEIVGVCSGRNAETVRELGADRVVDYEKEPFPAALLEEPPYDLVFDALGRHGLRKCSPILTPRGRYVTTVPSPVDVFHALRTRVWPFGRRERIVLVRSDGADLRRIAGWMESGEVRSLLDEVRPLDEVRQVHEYQRTFRTVGKNVLVTGTG